MVTSEELRKYRAEHHCSLQYAEKLLIRSNLCKELRSGRTINDIKNALMRILDFEFGGYNG